MKSERGAGFNMSGTPHSESAVRAALGDKLTSDQFSCVAGKTAWQRSTVVHRHLGRLGTAEATQDLHAALVDFTRRKDDIDPLLATFIATFWLPAEVDEVEFERLTWEQLQQLHERDVAQFDWDPAVSSDPESSEFGFSVGGHAFFVVGLHPGASRISRRFDHPTLVFNLHTQFERLRQRGIYQRIQQQVRQRELALQGSLNPNLAEFGEASEVRQYSGRAVPPDWRCPFHPHVPANAAGGDR
ncbi:guanitoxin biosynthesis heme-dependent pre-guanitoxin N-hydroxylase GntA [Micromonosporaceae bacterium Da 78-11]